MDMYKQATKLRLRFVVTFGTLTTEDLWSLPLLGGRNESNNLNQVAQQVSRNLKQIGEEDFVRLNNKKSHEQILNELRLDIVKDIIATKLKEQEENEQVQAKSEKKQMLLRLLEEKQHDELKGKSAEELAAMIENL